MRAVWIDEPTEVQNYPALRGLEVTQIFFSERRHTLAHLQQARGQGFQVGLYTNPQWYNFADPVQLAKNLNKVLIDRFQVTTAGVQCDVQINYETHDPDYIVNYFTQWRKQRPTRETSWTMEGHQAGWAWPAMNHPVLLGNSADSRTVTKLVPQAYDGSMNRWDSAGVVNDLTLHGIRSDRIMPFNEVHELRTPYSYGFFYLEHLLY